MNNAFLINSGISLVIVLSSFAILYSPLTKHFSQVFFFGLTSAVVFGALGGIYWILFEAYLKIKFPPNYMWIASIVLWLILGGIEYISTKN